MRPVLDELRLQPLTGDARPVSLADLRGRVVLLNFWGAWCQPCRIELPHIAELYKRRQSETDFILLAVSYGWSVEDQNIDALRRNTNALLTKMHITMPTYSDPGDVTRNAVGRAVGFEGYPTTLVLDRQGVIRGHWLGYEPGQEREMASLVDKLLKEKPK
jgi:thiol-disulfide isomerase/thioredoxin